MALRDSTGLMRRHRHLADTHGDPMESMGNLFDVSVLIAVGFLVVALSGFGLNEMLLEQNLTIVKNPGQANMEFISRKNGKIERLKQTNTMAKGVGTPVGTVFQLEDGRMVWVPGNEMPAGTPAVQPPAGQTPAGQIQPQPVP